MRDLEELNLLNQLIELGAKAAHAHAQSNSDDGHKGTAAYVQWQELRAKMGELIRVAYAPQADSQPAALSSDTLYLLRRLLSNQHTLTGPEFRAELEKIVECAAAHAPADSAQRDALPTIKGASITGHYVVVTPAGWGDGKATVLRNAILRTFPVNPAYSPKPDDAAPATKGGA